jgi:hypothetical protein
MDRVTIHSGKRCRVTLAPDQPLDGDAKFTFSDAETTVEKDAADPMVYHVTPGGTFEIKTVSVVGDADPDPDVDEPISYQFEIDYQHPHASTLGITIAEED